jgi:hypothetical protein
MGLFRRRPLPPVPDLLAAVADEIAMAYVACPGEVVALLTAHADAEFRLDAHVIDGYAEPHEVAMAAAEADGTRRALLALSPTAQTTIRRNTQETDR